MLLLALCCLGTAAQAQITLRLKGGWAKPSGEFREKVIHGPDISFSLNNSSSTSFAAEASLIMRSLPIDVALEVGRQMFVDETSGKIQETTYEYPEGTGRYSDYHHRIWSISLKAELPVALSYDAVTTLGVGWGWYFYDYVNLGDYDPGYDGIPSHSHPGWQISLTQTVQVYKRLGVLFAVEYHSFDLKESDSIGFAPPGLYNRINFYCIHLGLSIRVMN